MENFSNLNQDRSISKDEIDLNQIISFLKRNKKLISSLSLSFFIFSLTFSSFIKRTWQGEFQIVLKESKNISTDLIENENLRSFIDLDSSENLKTEVGILESPSILMPVFQFIKNKKYKIPKIQIYKTFQHGKKEILILS